MASCGKFNFLLSEGEYLLAYGHDRLHYLERDHQRGHAGAAADVVFVATEPLSSDDRWRAFSAGELRIYRRGRLVAQLKTKPRAPAPEAASILRIA